MMKMMKRCAPAALLCLLLLTACSEPTGECTWYAAHGGIEPVLMVDGALYHWARLNGTGVPLETEDGHVLPTYLPQGYEAAGALGPVSKEAPEADLQIQAGFDVTGVVFTDPDRPLVVYVHLTTDWLEDTYVRFESEELGHHLVCWDGRLFQIPIGCSQTVEELPEGCVSIGTLQYVGDDVLPGNDLECNGMGDSFGHTLTGREVLRDPADPDTLYVFETQYWREGSCPAWEVCRPWEPGAPPYPAG